MLEVYQKKQAETIYLMKWSQFDRIWIIVIAIAVVLALCVGIAFYFWNKDQQGKTEANRALHNKYSYRAGTLYLDVDTSENELIQTFSIQKKRFKIKTGQRSVKT
ncbi:hypothetical protein [Shouchella clausii]|jgi:flagellar basal body-associated protein FliL|uniref:hypothetical protein n=1 Tax=Shouchella clausii TaxID=79880 RepID=UPI0015960CE1|nr:hypothetical protein [Shouchella clausii]